RLFVANPVTKTLTRALQTGTAVKTTLPSRASCRYRLTPLHAPSPIVLSSIVEPDGSCVDPLTTTLNWTLICAGACGVFLDAAFVCPSEVRAIRNIEIKVRRTFMVLK